MNNEIKVHDNIAIVKIPFQKEDGGTDITEVYAHIIEYNGRLFTHHGNGPSDNPLAIMTQTFSDFETGYKIKDYKLFLIELAPYNNKEKAQQHIVQMFEEHVKPLIDRHEDKYDGMKAGYPILNKEIVYEQGELQNLLNECN